jgi:phage N-6-adenine-methyltransferase
MALNLKMLGRTEATSDNWRTPRDRFDQLRAIFGFTLDLAANAENALFRQFFTQEQNALAQHWCKGRGARFCNPPYGSIARQFADKAAVESRCPNCPPIVLLLVSRLDGWWHDIIIPHAALICFLKGRVVHIDPTGRKRKQPPFPSALVVFSRNHSAADLRRWRAGLEALGACWVPTRREPGARR